MKQPDSETIHRILSVDPVWGAYALADLQPDFAPYCRWHVSESAHGSAVALIFTGLELPTLFTAGPAEAVADAVAQVDLPDEVYITVREEHFDHVASLYDFSNDRRPMWRLALPDAVAYAEIDTPGLRRLVGADSEALRDLYDHGGAFSPDAFEPYQVDNGVFFGVVNVAGELVASGGTHIVDWSQGIGAIGNMYTRPDCRGQGHAAAVLRAIVLALRVGDVSNIVLNVDQRNEAARRLYEKYGFEVHCPYVEGIGQRRGINN